MMPNMDGQELCSKIKADPTPFKMTTERRRRFAFFGHFFGGTGDHPERFRVHAVTHKHAIKFAQTVFGVTLG